MRAIQRAELACEILGSAQGRAMLTAEARGNLMDFPLRGLLTAWWSYAAVTRTPELRSELPFYRDTLRGAVRTYRERGRRVPVEQREAA